MLSLAHELFEASISDRNNAWFLAITVILYEMFVLHCVIEISFVLGFNYFFTDFLSVTNRGDT